MARGRAALIALLTAGLLSAALPAAHAQTVATFTDVYSFSSFGGQITPTDAPLVQGTDGNFYGTTIAGGAYNAGTVFQVTPAGALQVLHSFNLSDGNSPKSGLVQGSDGNFYGTTFFGGSSHNAGTLFRISPAGVFTTLYSFTAGTDGRNPSAGLVQGNDGNFYGTTTSNQGIGTVFQVTPAGILTTIHTFSPAEGGESLGSLVLGNDGNFYGTTNGYYPSDGSVFRITPAGVLTILHAFTNGVNDGGMPATGLVLGRDGNFYGTSSQGGADNEGTVFVMTPAGAVTVLYSFPQEASDGNDPTTPLVQGNDGNFYGTTTLDGANYDGTLFRITPAGAFTTLYSFAAYSVPAGLGVGRDGNLYGTTNTGGANLTGTVYQFTLAGAFTILNSFGPIFSGNEPRGLVPDGEGNFYGVTAAGGADDDGTVYRITPAGVVTPIYSFDGGVGGSFPLFVLLGRDGNLYGATFDGGVNGDGDIFQLTPAGASTVLYSFDGSAGFVTCTGLVQGNDGNFYGTTTSGGANNEGTVFVLTPAGALTILYSFTGGSDGIMPGSLIQGSDGNFYGVTPGRAAGYSILYPYPFIPAVSATVFVITPAGALTTLYSFPVGAVSTSGLVPGSDGNFYFTAYGDGTPEPIDGMVLRITPAGVLTTVYTFTGGDDGSSPLSLLLASDGNFYGTTGGGGANGAGTVFQITPAGAFTVISAVSDNTGEGSAPGVLVQGTDGNFYGTNSGGGANGGGLFYKLSLLPSITSTAKAAAAVGQAFSYQIAATNSPVSYAASSLPAGLSVNPATGLIAGSPTHAGTYTVGLSATNGLGTGVTTTLTLVVKRGAPVISSALTATAQRTEAFTYQITASRSPTSFAATGLPAGLSISTTSGLISGTPTSKPGTFTVGLAASNAGGTGTATLTLTVDPAPVMAPVITSAATASAQLKVAFTYQITASHMPTSFAASGLPAGLSVDSSGAIAGTPTKAGTFVVGLSASNAGGTGTATLTLAVAAPPVINSALTATAQVTKAFSYQITATRKPTSFAATGLPAGLSIDTTSGLISGTPTGAGSASVELSATNAGGTGTATLTLTVAAAPVVAPAITSALAANGQQGQAFAYQITASQQPQSFSAVGLPPGLTVDVPTGLISGTPTAAGTFAVTLGAVNSGGTGTAILTLTVAASAGSTPPAFFTGEVALGNGVYYLAFPNGNFFGYYSFLSNPAYIYHFDLGYEYVFDANDGNSGVYFYDFASSDFFYTSPSFPFPYLYDFGLNSVVYYYPDPNNAGRYTSNPRYFYVFSTGQIISK